MAKIKTVWGPHKTTIEGNRIVWSFTGVYASGDFARWTLRFHYESRKFSTRAVSPRPSDPERQQLDLLPEVASATDQTGRVTPMLRALLKPDHIAEATRLAMEFKRKWP